MTHEKEFLNALRTMATAMEVLSWSIPVENGMSYEVRDKFLQMNKAIQNLEDALNAEEKSET